MNYKVPSLQQNFVNRSKNGQNKLPSLIRKRRKIKKKGILTVLNVRMIRDSIFTVFLVEFFI